MMCLIAQPAANPSSHQPLSAQPAAPSSTAPARSERWASHIAKTATSRQRSRHATSGWPSARPSAGESRTRCGSFYLLVTKSDSGGGSQVRSKAPDLGSGPEGVRRFKSCPPHHLRRLIRKSNKMCQSLKVPKMPRPTGPTNPVLRRLVRELRAAGKKQRVRLWIDLAERLERPRRARAEVNLSQLSRYSGEGNTIVVPGKVLAAGKLNHAIFVAAFKFSGAARRKITTAGGKTLTIQQLVEQNPNGKDVRLME